MGMTTSLNIGNSNPTVMEQKMTAVLSANSSIEIPENVTFFILLSISLIKRFFVIMPSS
jgi:deoxycytidine triphosphate deaminase